MCTGKFHSWNCTFYLWTLLEHPRSLLRGIRRNLVSLDLGHSYFKNVLEKSWRCSGNLSRKKRGHQVKAFHWLLAEVDKLMFDLMCFWRRWQRNKSTCTMRQYKAVLLKVRIRAYRYFCCDSVYGATLRKAAKSYCVKVTSLRINPENWEPWCISM